MNSERLLRSKGDALELFRLTFENTVGRLVQADVNVFNIDLSEFISSAWHEKERLNWSFEHKDVTEEELGHFEEVMLDYLDSLKQWRAQATQLTDDGTAMTTFFAQVFR
jgi:uncharacterized membrane protein YccC